MAISLLAKELEALRKVSTPAVCNAIETFNVRPRNEGFMTSDIRCLFPDLGVMVGYAATARIVTDEPPAEGHQVSRLDWWDYLQEIPKPRVVIFQDMDRVVKGAYWDEQTANIQKALGSVGVVTDGGVRDLDAMHDLGLHVFAAHVLVSRAYVHLVDFGIPVRVGGLTVSPGDLLHGDKHGITAIPSAIAAEVASAAARLERQDRQIVELCQSADFTLEALKERWKRIRGIY
jgi:4-hydroxy-4-methyl-2-oxoglutarate aldolase